MQGGSRKASGDCGSCQTKYSWQLAPSDFDKHLLLTTMYHEEKRFMEAGELEKEVKDVNHYLVADIQCDVFSVMQMENPSVLYRQRMIFVQNSVGSRRR